MTAQFKVVRRGEGMVALQSIKNSRRFLAIRDGKLQCVRTKAEPVIAIALANIAVSVLVIF